jgi:excisionase family DNA binding protein
MHASVQTETIPAELCGFDIPSFAKRLHISKSHVWKLVHNGAVKTVRIGKRRIIPSSELTRILGEAR